MDLSGQDFSDCRENREAYDISEFKRIDSGLMSDIKEINKEPRKEFSIERLDNHYSRLIE